MLAGSVATSSPPICRVYRNVGPATNTPPARPGIWAYSSPVPGYAALNWNSGDRETPQRGLSYNLRLGVTPGGSEIIRAAAAADGTLRLPRRGNMEQAVGLVLHGLGPGLYYWSVQAIDAGLGASAFAEEHVLVVEAPRIQWFSTTTSGGLCFEFIGDPALNYVVMASTNLRGWATVGVAQAWGPPWFRFCETNAPAEPVRFYRLRTP